MAIINQATKELQVKIVYYGPAKSGKTTNLEQVHANVQTPNPDAKGQNDLAGNQFEIARSSSTSSRWKQSRSKDSRRSSRSSPSPAR